MPWIVLELVQTAIWAAVGVPLLLTLPFLGLEVFVGLIQAFIFYILTLAFFAMATVSHGNQEEH